MATAPGGDGTASIEVMVDSRRVHAYQHWALCDHSVGLGMAGGLDGERL
ncbi:MAG: hypothetical protein R2867_42005 [Caldilineaceae bacterium]